MDFEVGDRIIMKKPHPCGSKEWEVLRVGIDFVFAAVDAITRSWCLESL